MKRSTPIRVAVSTLFFYAGCASAEGTKPHDMSTAQHEAAALQSEAAAKKHEQQAVTDVKPTAQRDAEAAAWLSTTNPTDQHRADAEHARELAVEHRAASQALRAAEAQACAGLPESDRVTSPFHHREDISEIGKAELPVSDSEGFGERTVFAGGRVVFRAVPGMSTEWLQRQVNCHLGRAAAVGFAMPEMGYCPLMLKGVDAVVSSAGAGFAITVTSKDPDTANEIWRRIKALGEPTHPLAMTTTRAGH